MAIKDSVLEAAQFTFKDLFTNDENRHFHRVVLAYVNQMFQQISGINLSRLEARNAQFERYANNLQSRTTPPKYTSNTLVLMHLPRAYWLLETVPSILSPHGSPCSLSRSLAEGR